MQIMIMSDEIKKRIRHIIDHARKHVVPISDMMRIAAGEIRPIGENEDNFLGVGSFKIVFSLEQQKDGHCYKHLSMSLIGDNQKYLPSIDAVSLMLKEFGFLNYRIDDHLAEHFFVWLEDCGGGKQAVNVIERDNVGTVVILNG